MQKRAKTSKPTHQKPARLAYRLSEVSAMVGVPVSTLRSMIHRKELNPIVGFKTWLLAAEDVQELLRKRLR